MKTISFAQNHEDILLQRAFGSRGEGFYIDVGACHPVFHSVTKLFYDRGWRGINIEPIPAMFDILAQDRVRDVNLPMGISSREGTMRFFEVPAAIGFSTFSEEQAAQLLAWGYELIEHLIPVTTLARVCEQHAVPTIDFLKIDVESHEREVLAGADWVRFRPRVVLIEATRPATSIPCHEDWESLLLSAGYLFAAFDGLNRYYVRAEDRALIPQLSVPANVLDGFETFEHLDRIHGLDRRIEDLVDRVQTLQGERDEFRAELEGTQATLAEFRKALSGSRRDHEITLAALAGLREEHGTTVSALADARREHSETLATLDETERLLQEMRRDLEGSRAELETARDRLQHFEGWGPTTVSLVRRLRGISTKLPLARSLLRQAIVLRRDLLTSMAGGISRLEPGREIAQHRD